MFGLKNKQLIGILMLLQLAICLPFMNSFPIGLDEPFSIYWANQDLDNMFKMLANENNPPLHFVLLHFWVKVFGISAWSVRSLSLLFSVLTIPVIYKLGRKILPKNYTVVFVLFFIFSNFHHYHALEARVYSLFVLLFSLVLLDLYRLIFQEKNTWWRLMIWNALLLYSHYLGGLVVGVEIVILLFFFKRIHLRQWGMLALSGVLSLVLYLPGFQLFLTRVNHFSGKGTWVPDPHWTELYGNLLRFSNSTINFFLFAALVLVLMYFGWNKKVGKFFKSLMNSNFWFMMLAFGVPYFGMFILSLIYQPMFLDRYLLFTSIPFFLIIVYLWRRAANKMFHGLIPLLFVTPMIVSLTYAPNNNREDDKLAEYTRQIYEWGVICMCPPSYDLTFMYHFDQEAFKSHDEIATGGTHPVYRGIYGFKDIPFDAPRFIYIDAASEFLYPGNRTLEHCKEKYTLMSERCFNGNYCVYLFER